LIGFADKAGTTPGGQYAVNAANGIDTTGAYPFTGTPNLGTDGTGQIFGFHSGQLANIALSDGSVRSINANITPAVISALVTRANGDKVGDY
jgi:prepilin-type processing-associated H-X9-DG protein